jgi:hypothetical protein
MNKFQRPKHRQKKTQQNYKHPKTQTNFKYRIRMRHISGCKRSESAKKRCEVCRLPWSRGVTGVDTGQAECQSLTVSDSQSMGESLNRQS